MSATIANENQRLLEQLCRSRDELDHFVRALSHDMTANFMLLDSSFARLKRSLQTADRDELDQEVAHVEACLRESNRFLDDLVLLARTGAVHMEPGRVNLDEVIDEVLFEQRELLSGRRVVVEVNRPLGIVWCNQHRVKQVLANLIRNAVIHGCDPDRPIIALLGEPESGAPTVRPMLVLRVHDNGPGIDSKFHEEIFLPGRRLGQARSDGSGMGLAIVKRVVEHYGGSVRIDGDCQVGTTIVLRLPAPTGEPLPQPHYDPRPSEPPDLRNGDGGIPCEVPRPHRHRRSGSEQSPRIPHQ
jgi:signal transduction histidine kinase